MTGERWLGIEANEGGPPTERQRLVFLKCSKGAIQVLVTLFSGNRTPHPPPRNANNVEPFLHLRNAFFRKIGNPHPHYVILEWP